MSQIISVDLYAKSGRGISEYTRFMKSNSLTTYLINRDENSLLKCSDFIGVYLAVF